MNTELPLLSIVIATKDRQKYVLSAIESILSLEYLNIQLVIQDNSTFDTLKADILKYSSDDRLVYRYINKPLSFIDNFNQSIELASGEYLCLIGDDDGINPDIIETTIWAKNNNVDAIIGSICANYRWEGTGAPNTFFTEMRGSTLTITDFKGSANFVDVEESLVELMKNGCTNYSEFNLPRLYHGIVKKSALDLIKIKTGSFISGLSPDMYSSVALACVINNMVHIDYPLTIPGVCAESGSIKEGQIKNHSKRLEDAPHFRNRGSYIWNLNVPRIYSVQTIWADSGFAAINDMERIDLINHFDKYKLYANIIYADKSTYKLLFKHLSSEENVTLIKLISESIKLFFSFLTGPFYMWFLKKRLIGRLKIILKIGRFKIINNITDINFAMISLKKYLNNTSIKLSVELSKLTSDLI